MSGIVVDENDQSVGGAEVFVEGLEGRQKTTQPNGNFEFRVPRRPRYILRIRAGTGTAVITIEDREAEKTLHIVLKKPVALPMPPSTDEPLLVLVDLAVADNAEKDSGFPVLDVKLRNKGTAAIVLKRTTTFIVDRKLIDECSRYSQWKNATWHSDLNLDHAGFFTLTGIVKAKGVGSFRIVLGHDLASPSQRAYYRLQLRIVYDEDDKTLISKEFWLAIPAALTDYGGSSVGESTRQL